MRFRLSLRSVSGRRLTYKDLTGKTLHTHRKETSMTPKPYQVAGSWAGKMRAIS